MVGVLFTAHFPCTLAPALLLFRHVIGLVVEMPVEKAGLNLARVR